MSLLLLYAASVIITFIGWYACGPIKSRNIRGVARASLVAMLCAPGLLIGHGIGVAPTLYVLFVQPTIFTLGLVAITWLIAVGLIFGIGALRLQENRWPPSAQQLFINGYLGKFPLFGLVYAFSLVAILYANNTDHYAVPVIKYTLFLAGAAINSALCFHAVKSESANPYLTPILFAAPVLFATAPTVTFFWYGGGVVGSLVARHRHRLAAQIAAAVGILFAANFLVRSYRAMDAPAHVTIEGGVAGNVALAALFIALAFASWRALNRSGSSTDYSSSK